MSAPALRGQPRQLDVGSQPAPEPTFDHDLPADVIPGLGDGEEEAGKRDDLMIEDEDHARQGVFAVDEKDIWFRG